METPINRGISVVCEHLRGGARNMGTVQVPAVKLLAPSKTTDINVILHTCFCRIKTVPLHALGTQGPLHSGFDTTETQAEALRRMCALTITIKLAVRQKITFNQEKAQFETACLWSSGNCCHRVWDPCVHLISEAVNPMQIQELDACPLVIYNLELEAVCT